MLPRIPARYRRLALGLFVASPILAVSGDLPLGLASLDFDAQPPPAAEVQLGQKLFFDKALSRDGTLSCSTCHLPAEAFAQRGQPTSKGIGGKVGRRNSPSLLNVTFARQLFHDGRSGSLEDQAWQPILAPDEMGNRSVEEVLDRLADRSEYKPLFDSAFGVDRPDKASVARALASFERTLLSGNSPFDRYYWGGELEAISPLAIEGFDLFSGQALCWQCHQVGGDDGMIFTDHQFHNTGVSWLSEQKQQKELEAAGEDRHGGDGADEPTPDLGRFEATGRAYDKRFFKTPSLRNIALTAPYMHDGSFETLEQVLEFYNRGGGDGSMQPLRLEKAQIEAIVAFLNCLTGDQKFATPELTQPSDPQRQPTGQNEAPSD